MPSTQQEILRLSRDVESGRTIYLQLLTRQQELNISRSSAVGNVRIIDEAVTPGSDKAAKALIIILGALFGLMLAMGTVLVRRAFKRGITLSEQLEAQGLPVLATLPRSEWLWSKTHLRRKIRSLVAGNTKPRMCLSCPSIALLICLLKRYAGCEPVCISP